jgi:hypothetical protein
VSSWCESHRGHGCEDCVSGETSALFSLRIPTRARYHRRNRLCLPTRSVIESRNYFHGANSLGAHAPVPRVKARVNSSLNAGCQEKRNNGYPKIGVDQMQTEVEVNDCMWLCMDKLSTHPHFPGVTKLLQLISLKVM